MIVRHTDTMERTDREKRIDTWFYIKQRQTICIEVYFVFYYVTFLSVLSGNTT